MTSIKEKINYLLSKDITREELKKIAERVYLDRITYSTRKLGTGKGKAVTAVNLIYYNQWILGPYLRELRAKKLPWYKRLFGGKKHGIQPVRKSKSAGKVSRVGGQRDYVGGKVGSVKETT